MPNSKARFIILKIVIAVMFAAVIWKLFDLQVLKGEQYYEIANDRMTTNIVEKAPRGEILDRYGTTLVSNKVGYSVVMQKTDVKDEEFNDIIKKLVDIFYSTQCEYYDDLPISFAPYQFKFEDENEDGSVEDEREAWFKNNSHLGKGIEENMSADQIMQAYKEIYKVSDVYSEDEQRRIVGIRYAAEASGLSQTTLFTVADDISVDAVTQIKERQDEFKGIAVINDYIRQYDAPGLATHILGRTGKINAEEYEANKDLGYGYNDIIGKQGIEKWGEQYLRGIDGTTGTTKEVNGKEITVMNDAEPVPGDYIVLTLDSDLQKVAEKSLEDTIQNIRASSGVKAKDGADCDAGSVAVIDVKTGDLLAGASYPTYDMSKFNEDYETLINNDAKPMWNRLVSGLYSPGSTFKPLTAIAALETGNLNVNEIASLGSNVKPVIQNENCSVLMLNDATGEGVMTVYRVMPGVMICFSDMHMEQCTSEFELKNNRKIFCIDHCREGRIEMEVKPGVFSIMQENELRLDNRENHKGTTYYPLKHYHGVSIFMEVAKVLSL